MKIIQNENNNQAITNINLTIQKKIIIKQLNNNKEKY